MRSTRLRLGVLLIGSSLGAVGWGAVLPFLYADVATARGLGAGVAAATFTAFALGALLASPVAGRLADAGRPLAVATAARLVMVLAIGGFVVARDATTIWACALAYGASLAVVQPATSVMLLDLTPARLRREIFAWQFIGQNLALAVGGFVGGHLVDLSVATGARPAYVFAAVGSVASAVTVWAAARGRRFAAGPVAVGDSLEHSGYAAVLRAPGVRWLLVVTVLLTLACYAQFDSGLPAYALSVLDVRPAVLGTAVALNAVLVAVLTAPLVRLTRHRSPARLLAACGAIWVGVWLLLGVPLLLHASAGHVIVAGYALFSLGETMLAPVLQPLAAQLAPAGAAGRTLAAVNGAQTLATAVGPGLSGVLLAAGLPTGFIVVQLVCCLVAVFAAGRLGHSLRRPHSRPGTVGPAADATPALI